MLRPHEMNKEMRNQQKQPTVIAKLMGLDALPIQPSVSAIEKSRSKNNNSNVYPIDESIHKHHLRGNICSGRMVPPNSQNSNLQSNEKIEIRDVCKVQKQSYRNNDNNVVLSSTGNYHGNPYEERMALVHRNFIQAKRLARNENLLKSREFQDALEVLSSNRDLFLKLLEEPNPWLSKNLPEVQSSLQTTHNKCITVLKPPRMMAKHIQEQSTINDPQVQANAVNNLKYQRSDSIPNPTRIVVLKPNPGKSYDWKDDGSVPSSSQRFPETDHVCRQTGDNETRFSREVAKEITRKMQQRLGINRRDENLLPSVLSNSYAGGEVPLRRSLNECMEEEWGNTSSQSKTPRHSWDCPDKCLSPCSLSSLSQTSLSPELSVVREAKKHLSERWAMVSSTDANQKHDRTCSSNTLGKMLAVPEVDRDDIHGSPGIVGGRTFSGEHEIRKKHEESSKASKKSVQILSSIQASKNNFSDTQDGKSHVPKDRNTETTARSLFKEKMSSLFSSRNKKFTGSLPPSPSAKTLHKIRSQEADTGAAPEGAQFNYEDILKKNLRSTPEPDHLRREVFSDKEALTLAMKLSENTIENTEQPSPISVLETAFEVEESKRSLSVPSSMMNQECGVVSKIPIIDSMTRSLSWDEDLVETSNMAELLNSPVGAEEEEWSNFVRTLLASSGLSNETLAVLAYSLHPLDGPLDTALLEKYVEPKREGAKSRQRRSNQMLIFDSVNFALLEIIHDETSDNHNLPISCSKEAREELATTSLTERVLLQLREWFSVGSEGTIGQGRSSRLMIDADIQKQVRGKVWGDMMKAEIIEMGREIERCVLDELVGEMLNGFVYKLL